MLKLLESGKDVVTANKALLAEHGPELFDRARELGRSIAFEAAVAGGIPIIANISQCLSANQITSLVAILNGTSNFVLTQMEERGWSYAEALAEAQRLGYAEADPTLDVDGSDAAQKLAILAHLAFGARVPWREIPRQGIDALEGRDMRFARELGYRLKLLAVAQLAPQGLELDVSPTLVRPGAPPRTRPVAGSAGRPGPDRSLLHVERRAGTPQHLGAEHRAYRQGAGRAGPRPARAARSGAARRDHPGAAATAGDRRVAGGRLETGSLPVALLRGFAYL
jgi:hypothetical protein